jgi:hypothetical protein
VPLAYLSYKKKKELKYIKKCQNCNNTITKFKNALVLMRIDTSTFYTNPVQ